MKYILAIFSFLILPVILSAQTYQEVKVHAAPESIRTIASLGLAVENGIYRDGIWETVLSLTEVTRLRSAGFTIDIIREDYSNYISARNRNAEQEVKEINRQIRTKSVLSYQFPVPVHFELGSMGGYYTPDQVLNELDSMHLFYPNLISQKAAAGSFQTVEGRNVYYVKISNTPTLTTNKPKILYDALTHAREPMGMQQLMFFMWYLLENYNTNEEVKYLVDDLEMYFIPIINPDGYAYNYQTNPYGGGMWRKNRKDDGAGNIGIDLNRNFGYMWGYDDQGSSPYPWDETYRGPTPFSENETQDIRDFCIDKKFKMAYNYHTYADQTMYPWCYITKLTPDSLTEVAFTDHMTAKNGYVTGPPGAILYNTNGDIMDWEYGEAVLKPRIICFTTETGNNNDGFWPLSSRIIPLAEENMYSNLQAAQLTLPFAEITDLGPVINSKRNGYFHFGFKRLGLTDSVDYTVSVKPLDPFLFAGTGPAKVIHYPDKNVVYTDSVAYSLLPGIAIGRPFRYIWQIDNGMTVFRDTVTNYYGWPMVLLSDSCNTMDNWTSTRWNISTKTAHSATKSLADSPSGPYVNNVTSTVTLKNKVSFNQSPVVVIEYWVRYGIEKSMDYCQLITSLDNGGTWTKQETRYTNNGSIGQDFPNPVYDGNRNWSQDRVVLPTSGNNDLLVKFSLRSDGNGVVNDGIYVDDFKVSIVDMTYNSIDPTGQLLGFISGPVPNPAGNTVKVDYQLPGNFTGNYIFQLFDSRGIQMNEVSLNAASGEIRFNVNDLPPGVYLYRISGNFGATAVKKLVVVH